MRLNARLFEVYFIIFARNIDAKLSTLPKNGKTNHFFVPLGLFSCLSFFWFRFLSFGSGWSGLGEIDGY